MSLLLKNLLVVDVNSPVHNQKVDVLIEDGVITSLQGKAAKNAFDLNGMIVTPGWLDLSANFNDPGLEHKEDIITGSRCASAGGFTDVCLTPSTNPIIESKADVNYINSRALPDVDLHVIASVSEKLEGDNLTEIMDLYNSGAVAFSSGDLPIWNSELLMKSLQYTSPISVPLIQNPRDSNISRNTHMHEGLVSTSLGLRGEPSISEEILIQRDLEILKYSGGSLHFSKLSTSRGVDLIREAKKQKLSVSCDVGIHHLLFTDEFVGVFDSNFKSLPPFRTEADRSALIAGIIDGTIDAICSNHRPQDQENKQLEFDLAEAGTISLQTFYSCLLKISDQVPFEILVDRLVRGSRKVLNLEEIDIAEGQLAKLAILNPEAKWILNDESNTSKSKNSPFWNKELTGKVYATVNKENLVIH